MRFKNSIDINAPLDVVTKSLEDDPNLLGNDDFSVVRHAGGVGLTATYAAEQGSPLNLDITATYEEIASGTRLHLEMNAEPASCLARFMFPIAWLFRPRLKNLLQTHLENVKAQTEQEAARRKSSPASPYAS